MIGLFRIVKESSIAAGVRRIEAVTGRYGEMWVQQEEDLLQSLALQLKSPVQMLPEKLRALLDENKLLAGELKGLRKGLLKQWVEKCLSHKEKAGAISLIAEELSLSAEEMSEFANDLIQQMKSGVVALGATMGERCGLSLRSVPIGSKKGSSAAHLIKETAPFIQGGGGGKQNLAQAGGKDPQGIAKAFAKVRHMLKDAPL